MIFVCNLLGMVWSKIVIFAYLLLMLWGEFASSSDFVEWFFASCFLPIKPRIKTSGFVCFFGHLARDFAERSCCKLWRKMGHSVKRRSNNDFMSSTSGRLQMRLQSRGGCMWRWIVDFWMRPVTSSSIGKSTMMFLLLVLSSFNWRKLGGRRVNEAQR